jgi:hypothetical protein
MLRRMAGAIFSEVEAMLSVAVAAGVVWFVVATSPGCNPPRTRVPAAPGAARHETGPLWEDGELVHDAVTGEPITWRRPK